MAEIQGGPQLLAELRAIGREAGATKAALAGANAGLRQAGAGVGGTGGVAGGMNLRRGIGIAKKLKKFGANALGLLGASGIIEDLLYGETEEDDGSGDAGKLLLGEKTRLGLMQDAAARDIRNTQRNISRFANLATMAASAIPGVGFLAGAVAQAGAAAVNFGLDKFGADHLDEAKQKALLEDIARKEPIGPRPFVDEHGRFRNTTGEQRAEALIEKEGSAKAVLDKFADAVKLRDAGREAAVKLDTERARKLFVEANNLVEGMWRSPERIFMTWEAGRVASRNFARSLMSRAASRTGD